MSCTLRGPGFHRSALTTITVAVLAVALSTGSVAAASVATARAPARAKPGSGRVAVTRPAAVTAAAPGTRIDTNALVAGAVAQVGRTVVYDPSYVSMAYPGGDVPMDRGVCTDVLIRAFRAVGIDLQVDVHEDMRRNFSAYPKLGKAKPDTNIDHRRVKNLRFFFTRRGLAQTVTDVAGDYLPGDIVMWNVDGLDHTGLVVSSFVRGTDRHQIVHNIGDGAQMEDVLFAYPVVGHFRYPTNGTGG